jgi:tRNA(Ile)-lysidine synthase
MRVPEQTDALRARFLRALAQLGSASGPGLVAVSGGVDSLALLHLLVETAGHHSFRPVVAHVDHGIDPDSALVAGRVRALAERLDLPFETTEFGLGPTAGETVARTARYRWLRKTAHRLGAVAIFTGHHADDQVETVLMRMLRGSGPAGLAGMAARIGLIVRPLLGFHRLELEGYVARLGLEPWADPANRAPRHLRSWIRGDLLPMLERRLPDVRESVVRVAHHAAAERMAWDQLLSHLPIDLRGETGGFSVASGPLRAYDTGLAEALIGAIARRTGRPIGPRKAARVFRMVCGSSSGARIELGQGWVAELRFDRLAVVRPRPSGEPVALEGAAGEARFGSWRVRWSREPAPGKTPRAGWTTWLTGSSFLVRPWKPGDRIRPVGGAGHRRVVRCLQEARVGRSERPGWPVVSTMNVVVWVPGVCRSGVALPEPHQEAMRIDVDRG